MSLDLLVRDLAELAPGSVLTLGHLPAVWRDVTVPGKPIAIEGAIGGDPGAVTLGPATTEREIATPEGWVLAVELLGEDGQPSGKKFIAEGDTPQKAANEARVFFGKRAALLGKTADPDQAALALGKVEAK